MAQPTRELVLSKAQRLFPDQDLADVLAILDQYGTQPYERERHRVQLDILKLSEGDLDELKRLIGLAKRDYRDVIAWAEYPSLMRTSPGGTGNLDAERRRKLAKEDLRQYLSWLQDTDEPDMSEYHHRPQAGGDGEG